MQVQEEQEKTIKQEEKEMCCDDSGRTADEHRAESPDGKCCIDG